MAQHADSIQALVGFELSIALRHLELDDDCVSIRQ